MRRVLVLGLLPFLACAGRPPAAPAQAAARSGAHELAAMVDAFTEKYLALNPSAAVTLGRHEFDGKLADWSATGLARQVALLEEVRASLLTLRDDALTPEQRFQRDYVLSTLDGGLFWLRDTHQPFTNPSFYFDHGLDPHTYVSVPYAPPAQRLSAFIAYARAIPGALQQIRANLKLPLPKTFINYAVAGFNGFADFYRKDVPRAFAAVEDPALQAELQAVLAPAAQAMSEMGAWFAAQREHDDSAYVLGAERFRAMLWQTERVAIPLDQLAAIGQADLQRNLDALTAACARYLPGGSNAECVAKQNADKPTGGAVEGARAQLASLRKYLIDHDIVSIPGPEEAKVDEAPPYMRQNFAYIDIPGPYERDLPSVYYIAPPDPTWPKADQDAYVPGKSDLMFTSVHEVWPGHFLQFLHSNRSSWRFGQIFVGYAFAEGWAHYAEELMVESGLAQNAPELHIGQLLNALLRNVRYMCAIGLHTQGMSVAECEQLFEDKAYQDAGNARQQAARGTYDPGYLNYTLGKLMIRKLRARWDSENPGHPHREFHDQFLSYGGPPIPLLPARMLKRAGGELL